MFIVCVKLLIVAYLSCSVSVSCEKGSRICDAFGGPFLQYASLNRPIISTRGADGRRSLVVNARQKIGPVKSHCNRPILLIISKLRIDLAISRLSDAYCKNTPPDAS